MRIAARNGNLRDYNTRYIAQFLIGNELRGAPTEILEGGAHNPRQPEGEGLVTSWG